MEQTENNTSFKSCPVCEARWFNSQLYWSTGKPGSELDLAGLVCNNLPPEKNGCINPCKNLPGGDTWEKRRQDAKKFDKELERRENGKINP